MAAVLDAFHTDTANSAGALRYSSSYQKYAQQFPAGITGAVAEVHLFLYKAGSPSGNVWAEIWSDSGDLPSTELCQSANVACSSITSTDFNAPNEITFTFTTTPATLTATTKYWIVLDGDYAESTSVWVAINRTDTTDQYADGKSATYTGTWGETANWDYLFKAYYMQIIATTNYLSDYRGRGRG
jgi:hypothetical protein